jgi:hypothetical protein
VAVFVDGIHHRYPEVQARDEAAERRLGALGYTCLRFGRHQETWPAQFGAYAWLFGQGAEPAHTGESAS